MVFPNLYKFQVKSSEHSITPFAGLSLIGRLAKSLGLFNRIDDALPFKERERGYRPSEKIMSIVNLYLAGGTCLNDIRSIRHDGGLTKLFGVESFPDDTTLGQFLHQFSATAIHRLARINQSLVRRLISDMNLTELTLDPDSSVIESHKQQAAWTYLEGVRGYNPLFASIAELHHTIPLAVFREGNASPHSHALSFSRALYRALPQGLHLRLRVDSAWYQADVLDFWHEKGAHFVVTADMDSSVVKMAKSIPDPLWKRSAGNPTVSIAESVHVLGKGRHAYRIVFMRWPKDQPDLFEHSRFSYHARITNIDDWPAEEICRWHRQRFTDEHLFDEFKNDLSGKRLPCADFHANAAFFQILVLAFNLVQYLKFRFLPDNWRPLTLKTIRFRLIAVAASVVTHARRIWLNLFLNFPYLRLFERLHWRLLAVG